jgi:hypothetical protein
MNLDIKHYGRIKDGRKIYNNIDLYKDQLASLEGCEFIEILKKKHIKVTSDQHAYYRAAILITCYKTEMFNSLDSKDCVHDEYFAPKFLSYTKMVTIGGVSKEEIKVRSLADLSKDEMTDFINRCLEECRELNIEIPDTESYYQKYYQR